MPVKPKTIQLRISSCPLQFAGNDLGGANGEKITSSSTEIGYGFVDIGEGWNPDSPKKTTYSMDVLSYNGGAGNSGPALPHTDLYARGKP